MQDLKLFSQILNLEVPWQVEAYEIDAASNRLDIHISYAPKRKLFERKKQVQEQATVILRHLPLLGMRTYLHVPDSNSVPVEKLWAPAGSSLTVEMENHVIQVLNNTNSKQAAATVSGLTLSDIRKISDRTGAGNEETELVRRSHADDSSISVETVNDIASEQSFDIDDIKMPDVTNDCWQQLIQGKFQPMTDSVSLQMLLQQIRNQIASNPSETTKLRSAGLLRQYFIKNHVRHKDDIALLNGSQQNPQAQDTQTDDSSRKSGLPEINASVWRDIVQGSLSINTSDIALQMMIERVRQSVERNNTDAAYNAAIKILRQFFIKHQNRLAQEIEQIGGRPPVQVHEEAHHDAMTVPDVNQQCWQQLIDGKLVISTNAVALQLMIERIRRSVSNNNSDSNRKAAIKILHQYFTKHRSVCKNEIAQLLKLQPLTSSDASVISIPSEAHPNWQKMIDGELQIHTDTVALKMMLQSIRLSVENNPGKAARAAAAKILRQYFVKHQNKHRTEIEQLIAA